MTSLGNKRVMAKNIQKYMDLNHISRNELCEAIGVKYTTLTDWIKGKTYPRIDWIEKMANYFGIRKSDLVEEKVDFGDLSSAEQDMLSDYRTLNDLGQQEATKRVHELTLIPSYVEDQTFGHPNSDNVIIPVAAHHQPGINGTEEEALEEVERLRRKYEKKD